MTLRPALLAGLLLLGGCLGRVQVSDIGKWRDGIVAQQTASAKPKLWYVGAALYDESWSENDVSQMASVLAAGAAGFEVKPLIFSNGALRTANQVAAPTSTNLIGATTDIAQRAQPGDIVLFYVSTHGGPGLLARKESGMEGETVPADEAQAWIAPLRGVPTVVILSACFSGSLIPALRADNRIVITAARSDRTSFGCHAGADHTVFGQSLLDALATPRESLHTAFQKVRAEVAQREQQGKITRPSEPQVSVGPAAAALYDAPAF